MAFDPEQKRQMRRRAYDEYVALCRDLGIAEQHRWRAHFTALKDGSLYRPTRQQLQDWWAERFTADEIFEMASALDTLVAEDEGRATDDVAA